MGVFTMPSLGADMEAGTLVEWLVTPGDAVHRGDVVAVVETQKGAIEIECFEDGTLKEQYAGIGEKLAVGAPLALILGPGETAPATPAAAPAPSPEPAMAGAAPEPEPAREAAAPVAAPMPRVPSPSGQAVAASPAARIRARDLGVDLSAIAGSGPGGAVVLKDVDTPPARKAEAPARAASPLEEMRRAIAAAMTRAKQTIPHFYLSDTIDVQPAMDWLDRQNADRPPDRRLLLGALFVRASALAAARVKVVNGHYVDGAFRPASQVNAGVAVALRGGGLVAPALIDAAAMTLEETMQGMRDLVMRARAGRLRSSEMTDGTITVSSLGETGAEAMTGVIFPPQVALVGLGAPQLRPWIVDGQVVPRHVVTLTLSADHRVSDGRQAAKFVAAFATLIAKPETL